MAIGAFLAMTGAEIRNCTHFPRRTAWLACHFSPYGSGLSNLPPALPAGSLLVLDDLTPIHGHDPEEIARQLLRIRDSRNLYGILLDFQRPGNTETSSLVEYLSGVLPCPTAVSDCYAESVQLPVFLPPVPPSTPLQSHLMSWHGREIWLDVSSWGEVLTLTEDGCDSRPFPPWEAPEEGFPETELHCHYQVTVKETSAGFSLWRTEEDFSALLEEAEALGVTNAVGLWQELAHFHGLP